jgi:FkbM family methyltransferase
MGNFINQALRKISKGVLNPAGFDLIRYNVHTSEDVLLQTILNHFKIRTVLDVGANAGQYAQGLYDHGYDGKIHSFEPIGSVYKSLAEKASARKSQWTTVNSGMGAKEEEVPMNISENFVSSSVLKITESTVNVQQDTRITHTEMIRLTTVDNFLQKQKEIAKPLWLKLDVQGYELEVLKGAERSIADISVVQAELSFQPIYDGAPLFRDIVEYLEKRNFEIYTIIPGFRDGKTGRMLQADGIFVNRNL